MKTRPLWSANMAVGRRKDLSTASPVNRTLISLAILFAARLLSGQVLVTVINDRDCAFGGSQAAMISWGYCPSGYGQNFINIPALPPRGYVILDLPPYDPTFLPSTTPACKMTIGFCGLDSPNNIIGGATTYLSTCYGCSDTATNIDDNSDGGGAPPPPPPPPPPFGGPPPSPPPPPCQNGSCASCSGMPTWWVSQPYISLWLQDDPLGYQPAVGSRISFRLSFKQREDVSGYNTNIFSVGKKWNCSWLSYVTLDVNGNDLVRFPGGMQRTFIATNSYFDPPSVSDYLTDASLSGSPRTGFIVAFPDGSRNVYGFIVTNASGQFQEAFLTQMENPMGQTTTLSYYPYSNADPVVRLESVVDGDGQTNWVFYNTTNSYSTNLISQIRDRFGRTNSLNYDNSGHLTNSIDDQNISSSFMYDANDVVTNLITPYGVTSFRVTDPANTPNGRSVLVTQPDGGNQLYLYQDGALGVPATYSAALIPNTAAFGYTNMFDTNGLNIRDTFFWGPRQYADLSTTNVQAFTANDFQKAQMEHWLGAGSNSVGQTVSIERDPSPDSTGNIQGQLAWYDYVDKSHPEYQGVQPLPLCVARVLPDGTTAFTWTDRNTLGAPIDEISTYSAGGTVELRTNLYAYDSSGIDLITTTNATGTLVSSNAYNLFNEVLTNFDALGEMTTYTYDSSDRLTSTTLPNGLLTTNIYGPDGFLAQQIVVGYSTNSYTYSNALVYSQTDARGLTTTNTWDNLNRLTSTIYPDGSYTSNQYSALDLSGTKDRMGNWTYFGYDSMRRKIAETNANGGVTLYNFCTCGSLDSVEDALGNFTRFFYDNQGNPTNTVYADGYSTTNTYNLLRQRISVSDSSGSILRDWFDNQGLLFCVSNTVGQVRFRAFDVLDRPTIAIEANGVSMTNTYDSLSRLISRAYPDGGVEKWVYTTNISEATSYTNQIGKSWLYGYDGLSRKTNETCVGLTTNQFTYSGAGDLLALTDGNRNTTGWGYDQYGQITNKLDAAQDIIFKYGYDADNRLTNRWTPAKGTTIYGYDPVGNLTNVTYQHSPSISLSYDADNRLTNMVDGIGTTAYSYDQAGQLLSEGGLWPNDIVDHTYQNRLRMQLSLAHPSGPPWTEDYEYDDARRLTGVESAPGTFGYTYDPVKLQRVDELTLPNSAYITNFFDSVARLLSTSLISSNGVDLDSQNYLYNTAGQRTAETNAPGDYRTYSYDSQGELTKELAHESNGSSRMMDEARYTYDAAGNMTMKEPGFDEFQTVNYTLNNLNEITNSLMGVPYDFGWSISNGVSGSTTSPATNVVVNGVSAAIYADSSFYATLLGVTNGPNTCTAIAWDTNGNVSSNSSTVYAILTNGFYAYDQNGNLTNDGYKSFAYDDENELIGVWVTNAWSNSFAYDGKMRRRIERDYAYLPSSNSYLLTNEVHFIYDGNVVVEERNASNVLLVSYTRGNDLSGTLEGAGGIGGLLARTTYGQELPGAPTTAFYHADGNGNIIALIYPDQQLAAKYLYDPFGNMLAMSGPLMSFNKYRFSSKEWSDNSGLYYYGYRLYDPNLERWPNRDPFDERGFQLLRFHQTAGFGEAENPYLFARNDPIVVYDPVGLDPNVPSGPVLIGTGIIGAILDVYAMSRGCDTIGPGQEAFGRTPSSQLAYFSWILQSAAQAACHGCPYQFRTRVYKDKCGNCHYGGLYVICLCSGTGA
jgi:RHS repeat-associated protein